MIVLKDYAITHGGIKPVVHPRLGVEVNGQTVLRTLRFGQPVCVDHLELARVVYGRWVPDVPTHPAHLLISVLDEATSVWKIVREVDLPFDPRIAGEGLTQDMSIAQMNEHFAAVMQSPPQKIDLGGLLTDHLRVECDREHPVWPNHGECNGGEYNVPFGILNGLSAHGTLSSRQPLEPVYLPPLTVGEVKPVAPHGMRLTQRPDMLLFESEQLSVGFSLARPMLMHLGWDAHKQGSGGDQRLLAARRGGMMNTLGGGSGPLLRTLQGDWGAHAWTGDVAVVGNCVAYRNLRCIDGLSIDAVFTVEADRLMLELTQRCDRVLPLVEVEAWRLAWDLTKGITGAMAMPTLKPGRNGDVELPMLWATDAVGCLGMRAVSADQPVALQVEGYRVHNAVTGGIVLAPRPDPEAALRLLPGVRHAVMEWTVDRLQPDEGPNAAAGVGTIPPGVASRWATVFACFRPEYGGFSNNSSSVNCHVSHSAPIEIVARTKRPEHGPDPLDLARFTIERALLDGGGYGYWRNLYMDSDPVLISTAGRLHQVSPNMTWLRRIEPGLIETARRMLATLGENELVVCHDLSGNSGSYRWSSNSIDVVGFGHIDGYVNAWSYRAFRNATALLTDLGQGELAARTHEAANTIKANYARVLLNPATGWVAGWRSRDGELHDYAFLYVNGMAMAYGLVEPAAARNALLKLEALRAQVCKVTAQLGLPLNLLPIRRDDHMLPEIMGDFTPTFETYTDGSLSGWPATYYLRALSIYGLREQAQALTREMDAGYAAGVFNGGIGTGHEFRSWDGLPTGYEGTLIGCFAPLYAIAIEHGVIAPSTPEWWPLGAG